MAEAFLEVKAQENYNIIVRAAKHDVIRGVDERIDRVLEAEKPITEERIGGSLIRLSDGFRSANTKGYFTAYEAKQRGGRVDKYSTFETIIPRNDGSGGYIFGGKETKHLHQEAPWDARRRPIQLEASDIEALSAGTENDKIVYLSEILNPYRYRNDIDTPKADIDAKNEEVLLASDLLSSLPESWRRDLMATAAVKFYLNKNINKPELAQNALQLFSTPELRDGVLASIQLTAESSPQNILNEVMTTSPKALEDLLQYESEDQKIALKQEALEKDNQFAVQINISLVTLEKILFDKFHMLSFDRTKTSSATGWGNGVPTRRYHEDQRGFHPAYEAILDRPIYAALALSDKEKITGTAERYGNCVITLKDEVAQNRTIYTYGDSVRNSDFYRDQPKDRLAMPEAKVAKIQYQKEGYKDHLIGGDYIEAQILGGVDVNDIESLTIPYVAAIEHRGIIGTIQQEYPSLQLCISVKTNETRPEYIISEDVIKWATDHGVKVLYY